MLTSTLTFGQGYIFSYNQDAGNPPGPNLETTDATTSGWTTLMTGPQSANTWSPVVTIPFSFSFYGAPVTGFKASQNGLVTFNQATTMLPGDNDVLPTTLLPDSTIAVLWDDFTASAPTGSGDNVIYQVFGTAPNRQLWIKWYSFEIGNPANSFSYFAVALEEGTNSIYVVDQYSSTSTSTRSVGLQLNTSTFIEATNNYVVPGNGSSPTDNDYWAFTPPVPGVEMEATEVLLSSFANGGCGTAAEQISIVVKNNGTASVTNPTVTYTVNAGVPVSEVLTGTLNTGDIDTFTFATTANFSAVGTYTVDAGIVAVGDVDPLNNIASATGSTTAPVVLPLAVVDFDGYTSSNLPTVTGNLWYEANGDVAPDSGNNSYWVRDDFGNVVGGPNDDAAKINLYATNRTGWIVGPKFTAQSNSVLSFDLAMTAFANTNPGTMGSDDRFQVMVSTDCGGSFSPINTYNSTTPISNIGQNETYSLAGFAGQDVIVAFFATDGTVNDPEDVDLFIDNILLYNQPPFDLGVSDIILPEGEFCATPQGFAVVDVTNFGTSTIDPSTDPFDVTVEIDGTTYNFSYNSGAPVPPGATVTIPVSPNVDLSTPGVFNVKAWTSLLGANPDGLAANDTTNEPIEVIPVVSLPIVEDFETGFSPLTTFASGWSRSTTSAPTWQVDIGTTSSGSTGPEVDHTSGTATGQYVYLETSGGTTGDFSILRSPCLDLSASAPQIIMEYWYHMYGATTGRLDVQVWTDVDTFAVDSIIGEQQTASSDPWQKRTISLGAFIGQNVKIAFVGTRGTSFTGDIAIDDIFIFEAQPFDIAAIDLELPVDNSCMTNAEPVIGTVVHNGITPIDLSTDTLKLNLDVAGFPLQTVDITTAPLGGTTLNPGDTVEYTFFADYSQGGLIPTVFYAEMGPDALLVNDTIDAVVSSGSFTAPYFEPVDPTAGFASLNDFGPGWTQENTGSFQWQIDTDATGSSNTGPGQDHTTGVPGQGLYMYTEASSGTSGDSARLISPCIDLGSLTMPRLEFWYHMFGADMGDFQVEIEDGSGNLTQVFSQSGQIDTAEADIDPWNRVVVDLTPYAGQTINLHFTGIRGSSFGGDMSIDDILIYQPTGIDVGVAEVYGPAPACMLTPQTIDVAVVNYEQVTLDLTVNPVTVTLETTPATPGAPFTATVPGDSIPAGDTVVFTVTTLADFSAGGYIDLEAYTTVANDAIPFNDAAEFLVTALPLYAAPYSEDFSTFTPDGLFSGQGTGTPFSWVNDPTGPVTQYNWSSAAGAIGTTLSGPNVDHTLGTNAGVYVYTEGSYGSSNDSTTLLSSCIDLSATTDPVLEFWYHMYGSGMGTLIANVIEGDGTSTTVWALSGQQQTDDLDPWAFAFANLVAWAGDTIQIEFVGVKGSDTNSDMAIDDVYVGPPTSVDVAALSILSPASPGCLDSTMMVEVQVVSQGAAIDFSTTNLVVSADLSGVTGPALFDTTLTTGILGVGDTLTLMLNGLANLGAAGNYQIDLSALLVGGDSLPGNDVLSVSYLNVDTVTTPVGPVEFIGYNGSNLSTVYPGWDEGFGEIVPEVGATSSWVSDDFGNVIGGPNGDAAKINLWLAAKDDWIVAPPFVAGPLDILSYDIAITPFSGTTATTLGSDDKVMVMVSLDCGATYMPLKEYNNTSSVDPAGQSEFINLSQFAGQEIRVAFYATEGVIDDPEDNDIFLDNIMVAPGNQFDAALVGRPAPASGGCGDSTMMGELSIMNLGVDTLENLPLEITVTELSGTAVTVFNDTFPGPLGLGDIGSMTFGPFDTYFGGEYEIKAIAMLAGDQVVANDTIVDTLTFLNAGPPAVTGLMEFCPGDSLLLIGDTAEIAEFMWYDVPTGGVALYVGDSFQTPPITAPTTYYVGLGDVTYSVGPADNTIGSGAQYTFFGDGLVFDALQTFSLDSVTLYPGGAGDIQINIEDGSGTPIAGPFTYTFGGTTTDTTLFIGALIPSGTDYQMHLTGSSIPSSYRNSGGASFPYTGGGAVEITNTINGLGSSSGYYYFFYDWKISSDPCDRPRREIVLEPSVTQAGFSVDSTGDLYLALSDTSMGADSVKYLFGDGGSSTDPNPIYNYADTGTYMVQQVAYSFCGTDTFETQVTITCVSASGGFTVDSTGDLFVAVSSNASKADSVKYLFGDGNSSTDPNATHMYADTGTYMVQQVAYHFCGNDTTTEMVTITCAAAVADFNIEIVPDSNGVTVRFISQAQNADSVMFDFGNGVTTTDTDFTYDFEFTGTYTFCMTAYNLCGEVQSCQEVFLQNTGLDLIEGGSISIYPNPTEGEFDLGLNLVKATSLDVEVVDMRGRSLHQESFEAGVGSFKHHFDLQDRLSEGVYLIKIIAGDQMIMRKLQVE